jgi:hypothetical protein
MKRVAWIPGWYELDQPLEVGIDDEFVFWRVIPDYPDCSDCLVFYNTLWNEGDGIFASGKIVAIRHPELGDIRKIETRGLDYTVTLTDGKELLANAEEDPGRLYEGEPGNWVESKRVILGWRCEAIFESLSDLTAKKQTPTNQAVNRSRR